MMPGVTTQFITPSHSLFLKLLSMVRRETGARKAPPTPWMARAAKSVSKVGAEALKIEPKPNSAIENSVTGRVPNRSDR